MSTTGSQVIQALGMMLDDKNRREERKDLLEFQSAEKAIDLAYREKTAKTQRQIQVQTQLFNKELNETNALKTQVGNKLIEDVDFANSWEALGLDINSEHSTTSANMFADNKMSEIESLVQATSDLDREETELRVKLGKVAKVNHTINDLTEELTFNVSPEQGDDKDSKSIYDITDYNNVYDAWKTDNIAEGTSPEIVNLYDNVFNELTAKGKVREANSALNKQVIESYKASTEQLKNEMELKKSQGILVSPLDQANYYEKMIDISKKEVQPLKDLSKSAAEGIVPHFKLGDKETFKDSKAWKRVKEGFKDSMDQQVMVDGKVAMGPDGETPLTFKDLFAENGEVMESLRDIGTKAGSGFDYLAVGNIAMNDGGLKEALLYANKEGKTILELAVGEQNAHTYSEFVTQSMAHKKRGVDLAKEMYPNLSEDEAKVMAETQELENAAVNKNPALNNINTLNEDLKSSTDFSQYFLESDTLSHRLIDLEGAEEYIYTDTEGFKTGGIGHKLTEEEASLYVDGDEIPQWQVLDWFEQDSTKAIEASNAQMADLGISDSNGEFSEALVDVNFQLGVNWASKFPKAYEALKAGEYDQAVWEINHKADGSPSDWSQQTKNRVDNFSAAINKLAFEEFSPNNFKLSTDFETSKDLNMPILEGENSIPSNASNREVLMELEKELKGLDLKDVAAFISNQRDVIGSSTISPNQRERALMPLIEIAGGKTGDNAFFGEGSQQAKVDLSSLDDGGLRQELGYGTMGAEYDNTVLYNTSGEMRDDFNINTAAESLANIDDYGDALATLNLLKGIKDIVGKGGKDTFVHETEDDSILDPSTWFDGELKPGQVDFNAIKGLHSEEEVRLIDKAWDEIKELGTYNVMAEAVERAPNNELAQKNLNKFIEVQLKERGVNL
jgi:aromatic ring-opening dioxygenase LigB subunit